MPDNNANEPRKKITVADLLREIGAKPEVNEVSTDRPEEPAPSEGQEEDEVSRQLKFARLNAFTNHHSGKRHWSIFMMGVLASLILFQMLLLGMVGAKYWDFTKYDWLLPLLLVQNLAQIIGLAHVIVKALFDSFKE